MGLFDDNRYTDLAQGESVIGGQSHREIALESAYQSIVLLKNDGDLLPFKDSVARIAVIGPMPTTWPPSWATGLFMACTKASTQAMLRSLWLRWRVQRGDGAGRHSHAGR